MIAYPPRDTKMVTQTNRGNVLGHLWATFGIDLQSNQGLFRLGRKFKINTNTAGQANLGFPVAFQYFDSRMWSLAGDRVFKNTASDVISAFIEDASTNFVTTYDKNYADMLVFNGALVATADTKIWSKASSGGGAGVWTERGSSSLTTSTNHKLCYFVRHNRLYVLDAQTTIKSIDTSWSVASSGSYFIDLGTDIGRAITMIANTDKMYIGTLRPTATTSDAITKASVLQWDGISPKIDAKYEVDAQGVLAFCLLDNVPHLMDSNGILRRFSGSGFDEVGRLPIDDEMLSNSTSTFNERFIHPNGMVSTKNGTILVLVNNLISDNAGSIMENFPSGIWEWSKENGFVHKHSLTLQPVTTTTITDNGQNRIAKSGALMNTNIFSTSASGRGTMICGAQYYTDASTATFGIFIDSPIPVTNATTTESKKFGYFVTQFIPSQMLKDNWKKIAVKYRKFLDSSDRIIVKYRFTEVDPTYIDITWVNTTSFTTSTNVTALSGYEVEVIQGTGSGKCAHITSVTGSGPYTVNLDETFTGVTTGTAKARLQAWVKLLEASDQLTESKIATLGKSSERIQIKICMQFTGDGELHEALVVNSPEEETLE